MKKEKSKPAPIVYPRKNGYYMVRWGDVIQPALYHNGLWWLTHFPSSFTDVELGSENIGKEIDCSSLN